MRNLFIVYGLLLWTCGISHATSADDYWCHANYQTSVPTFSPTLDYLQNHCDIDNIVDIDIIGNDAAYEASQLEMFICRFDRQIVLGQRNDKFFTKLTCVYRGSIRMFNSTKQ